MILDILVRDLSFLNGWQNKFLGPLYTGDMLVTDLVVLLRHQFL
jgi:hypothetical protein